MYIFIKVFFKTNLFIWFFHISKLNNLKVIHNLYSQCLIKSYPKQLSLQILSISSSLTMLKTSVCTQSA